MNTPAHVVLSAVALGRGRWHATWLPISVGALLPDLPMFGFYAYQRLLRGTPETTIWSTLYFDPSWQLFFDLFNSLPLIGVGAAIAWRFGASGALALFASMALHCLADLPLHNDDAHRHFLPLTSWRFASPISYWDPRYFGRIVGVAELGFVVAGSIALVRRGPPLAWRNLGVATLAIYAAFVVFALTVWL